MSNRWTRRGEGLVSLLSWAAEEIVGRAIQKKSTHAAEIFIRFLNVVGCVVGVVSLSSSSGKSYGARLSGSRVVVV